MGKLRKMRMLSDDDDEGTTSAGPSKGQASQQPAWMRNLLERCHEWEKQLPEVRGPSVLHIEYTHSSKSYRNSARSPSKAVIIKIHYTAYSLAKATSVAGC